MEIVLRLIGYQQPMFHRIDDFAGLANNPGAEGRYRLEGDAWVKINSRGLRDREHVLAKPPNTFRIAILGDSFAAAFEVPQEQTFWSIIERNLATCPALRGQSVEVINFGVGGYGTAQELETLRHRAWDYSPNLVLLAFFAGNDARNNSRALERDAIRPFYVLEGDRLVLDDSFRTSPVFREQQQPLTRLDAWLTQHLRILQAAKQAQLHAATLVNRPATGSGDPAASQDTEVGLNDTIHRPPTDPAWQAAWRVTEALLSVLNDEVQAHGARFLAATLTSGQQVDPDPAVRQRLMDRLGVSDLLYSERRIRALGERVGFPVVNLAPAFQAYAEAHQVKLHGFGATLGKGHWNAEGHRLAGEILATAICNDPALLDR